MCSDVKNRWSTKNPEKQGGPLTKQGEQWAKQGVIVQLILHADAKKQGEKQAGQGGKQGVQHPIDLHAEVKNKG